MAAAAELEMVLMEKRLEVLPAAPEPLAGVLIAVAVLPAIAATSFGA